MKKIIIIILMIVTNALVLQGQVSDPVPGGIASEGLTVEIEEFVSIPASSSYAPRARINMLRPVNDCSGRLFVNDLNGRMYVIDDGEVHLFLDLAAVMEDFINAPRLGTGFGSIAFDPEFAVNGRFYTGHSEAAGSAAADLSGPLGLPPLQQGVVTEWTMCDPSSTSASNALPREILRIDYSSHIHALQEIAFNLSARPCDEDYGLLYITMGDSGSIVDKSPSNTGHIRSPLGSILRIDPRGHNSANGEYGIPSENPWACETDPDVIKELYAIGFRNPHRITWDPSTGVMLCGNIGEKQIEEVEQIVPGGHYGWPYREGTFLFDINDPVNVYPLPPEDEQEYVYPVAQYDHDEGFAITGGIVYRGCGIPELYGKYIFGDIRNGRIFYVYMDDLSLGSQATIYELTLTQNGKPTTLQDLTGSARADLRFGYDNNGEIYILSKTDGKIRKLVRERPTLDIHVTDEGITVLFETDIMKSYQVAASRDLTSWADCGALIPGNGSKCSLFIDRANLPEKMYFKLKVSDKTSQCRCHKKRGRPNEHARPGRGAQKRPCRLSGIRKRSNGPP